MGPQFTPLNTILIALTSAGSAGVSPSSGSGLQALEITNLSTNNVFYSIFPTSTGVATLPTTAARVAGGWLGANVKNVRVAMRPGGYVSAMTTGAALTGILALTGGQYI